MAITLDGTNGITTPDVESSGPISGTNGTFTGNVGIGTTSPTFTLQAALPNTTSSRQIGVTETVYTANFRATYLDLYGASATGTTYGVSNANLGALKFQNTSAGLIGTNDGVPLVFATTSAERARIDASGNLLVGTTTLPSSSVSGTRIGTGFIYTSQTGTSSSTHLAFINSNGQVGGVVVTGSSTAYNTSSDYRLKENVAPMQNALDTVAQLNPVTYTWKADGSAGQGFIAHELQAVVPDCVSGEKDAVDAEGNPQYQGVDTSFLVGILTKAIQEQQAMITALQADIAALKGV